jgi:hypothetical protein
MYRVPRSSLDWIVISKPDMIPVNLVGARNTLFIQNDVINAFTGGIDPGDLYSALNFDIPR